MNFNDLKVNSVYHRKEKDFYVRITSFWCDYHKSNTLIDYRTKYEHAYVNFAYFNKFPGKQKRRVFGGSSLVKSFINNYELSDADVYTDTIYDELVTILTR